MRKSNDHAATRKGKIAEPAPVMTGEQSRAWRERRKLSRPQLADLLDMHPNTLASYENGYRSGEKDSGPCIEPPRLFRLALAALAAGILDYDGEQVIGPPCFVTVVPTERPDKD